MAAETADRSADAQPPWYLNAWITEALGALALVLGIVAGQQDHAPPEIALLVAAAVAILLAGFLRSRARRWRDAKLTTARDLVADLRRAIDDGLDPIAARLGDIVDLPATATDKEKLRGQVCSSVGYALVKLIGPDSTRVAFFEYKDGPPRKLVPDGHWGRAGRPSTTFVEGTPAGDAALRIVDEREPRFYGDTTTDPPPGWVQREGRYRTFISVPVVAGSTKLGMLAVDSLNPGDLSKTDIPFVQVMANMLAAGLRA